MPEDKEITIEKIFDELNCAYLPESAAYQKVKRGLMKLSKDELSSLYVMVLTRR